mmetsp:Transcript_12935/g.45470  ORF Transcript_12935/g.45470 Transcript_12935/m.45470 type:complete len:99 (-) Transcript_12935:951-1247(-)
MERNFQQEAMDGQTEGHESGLSVQDKRQDRTSVDSLGESHSSPPAASAPAACQQSLRPHSKQRTVGEVVGRRRRVLVRGGLVREDTGLVEGALDVGHA